MRATCSVERRWQLQMSNADYMRLSSRWIWAVLPPLLLVLCFRIAIGSEIILIGLLNDCSFIFMWAAVFVLLSGAQSKLLQAALAVHVVLWPIVFFANYLNYEFFSAYLTIDALKMAHLADDAADSVGDLTGWTALIGILVLPMLVGYLGRQYAKRLSNDKYYAVIFMLLSVALFGSACKFKAPNFVAAQTNPVTYLLLQGIERSYKKMLVHRNDALTPLPVGTADLINISSSYQLMGEGLYPFAKEPVAPAPNQNKLNIILVVMESTRGFELGSSPMAARIAPNITRMAKEGYEFPNLYFNGSQTARGELAILCSSLPYFEGGQAYTMFPNMSQRCLPDILKDAGYSTHWFLGYDYQYANHFKFLSTHGFQHLHGIEQMKIALPELKTIGWGVADVDSFRYGIEQLSNASEPFLAEFLTMSNHHPFDHDYGIPDVDLAVDDSHSKHYSDHLRGVHYTDYAIGKLIELAQRQPWFDNTLFVIVGDHGVRVFPNEIHGRMLGEVERTEMYFRSGMVVWAPKHLSGKRFEVVGSQIDIAPTLLDLVGVRTVNAFQGVNLLDDSIAEHERFAVMLTENAWSIRQGNNYCYAQGQSCFKRMFPQCAPGEQPQFTGHACFNSAQDLLGVDPPVMNRLGAAQQSKLLRRAAKLIEASNAMLERDLYLPAESRRLGDASR